MNLDERRELAPQCARCSRRHLLDLPCWSGRYAQHVTRQVLREQGRVCWLCGNEQIRRPADSTDHVVPRSLAGTDAMDNLRPAHRQCNSSRGIEHPFPGPSPMIPPSGAPISSRWITSGWRVAPESLSRQARGMRAILLAGPPCAGKSTLAKSLARSELDSILDFDDVAVELGSPVAWNHPEPWASDAEQVMRERIAAVPTMPGPGSAYIIRAMPVARHRAIARRTINAISYVVDPGIDVCLARAESRPAGTVKEIHRWYAAYTRSRQDRPVAELTHRVRAPRFLT